MAISQQSDPDVLSNWFELAIKSATIDAFRHKVIPQPATNGKGV